MRNLLLPLGALLLLLTACGENETTACGDSGSSTMCPGSDCLDCHGFKAAGTVFASDGTTGVSSATVAIVDSNGGTVTRTTNSAGNFYTSSTLVFPLQSVTISKGAASVQMTDVASGGCNGCHDSGFRIVLP